MPRAASRPDCCGVNAKYLCGYPELRCRWAAVIVSLLPPPSCVPVCVSLCVSVYLSGSFLSSSSEG